MLMIAAAGMGLSIDAYLNSWVKVEYVFSAISCIVWLVIALLILYSFRGIRTERRKADFTDVLIAGLFAYLGITQMLSWIVTPVLSVAARLSTSPVVVFLCFTGMFAVIMHDRLALRISSLAMVIFMAVGRFTFHILNGAPPISSWNLFEMRFAAELLIPVAACALSFIRKSDSDRNGALFSVITKPFFTDELDKPEMTLKNARIAQLVMCGVALILFISIEYWGGMTVLNVILVVPVMIGFAGERNNKRLLILPFAMKIGGALADYLNSYIRPMYLVIVAIDILAIAAAIAGKRKLFSMIMMSEMSYYMFFMLRSCCAQVARDSTIYFDTIAVYTMKILICMSLLFFAYGKEWSNATIIDGIRDMVSFIRGEETEDERIMVVKRHI